jgi:hypothetical protein
MPGRGDQLRYLSFVVVTGTCTKPRRHSRTRLVQTLARARAAISRYPDDSRLGAARGTTLRIIPNA